MTKYVGACCRHILYTSMVCTSRGGYRWAYVFCVHGLVGNSVMIVNTTYWSGHPLWILQSLTWYRIGLNMQALELCSCWCAKIVVWNSWSVSQYKDAILLLWRLPIIKMRQSNGRLIIKMIIITYGKLVLLLKQHAGPFQYKDAVLPV